MNRFAWQSKYGLKYITVPEWENRGVSIGFSSRLGGVSPEPYKSLNLALHVGDDYNNVIENRRRYLSLFALPLSNMVCCEQVHGNSIVIVDKKLKGSGAIDKNSALPGCDAMVTAAPEVLLTAFYADCIPLFFFDPEKRVVGLAHSGWKGTMGHIAVNTVRAMQNIFNCFSRDIQVFIGPGIGSCCFAIGDDLAYKVQKEFSYSAGILKGEKGRFTWDLRLTIKIMLEEVGIKSYNIIDCNLCTACDPHNFFSYRRDQGRTGRMAAVIALNY